ncbi:MAG: hypothetical protein IT328_25950, partial [Caldilineaceae bacterium]|nr:hypothetical protein [Caldilineaceae bacterium]
IGNHCAVLWRETLHLQALQALMTLSKVWEARGNLSRADLLVERVLQMDPSREEAHRQKMYLLRQMGKPEQALAQYEACKRRLSEELGVEPDDATTALARQIQAENSAGEHSSADPLSPLPDLATPDSTAPDSATPDSATPDSATWTMPSPYHPQSYVPEQGRIYGRQYDLDRLTKWLTQERCRLIALLGMGGIGKTTLAAAAVRAVASHFDIVLWRSLINSPPLDEILHDWLEILSGNALARLPESLDAQFALLLDCLRERRCLLVLDNLESVFQPDVAGQIRPERQGYAQLIQRVGELQHQSCLLLTSREYEGTLSRLEGNLSTVRSLQLDGLDMAAAESMLHDRGLTKHYRPVSAAIGAEKPEKISGMTALVNRYSGNPLALTLVAETVLDLFGGDIESFLATEAVIFEDIRAVLDWQFGRLPPFEQEILLWLAVEREPISLQALRDNLVPARSAVELITALRGLRRRSLLDQIDTGGISIQAPLGETRFALQNVLMEYLTDRLIGIAYQEFEQETLLHLHRHALMKAQSSEYVRQSQVRLILHPLAERLQEVMGKEEAIRKLTRILAGLRMEPSTPKGYGAGNLLNLLLDLGADLTGYDFSRLRVWQADLRHANLPAVNFAEADLSRSCFAEGFGYMYAVAYSPDGTLLAAGSSSGDLRLWHAADGRLLHIYQGHKGAIKSVAFSPHGTLLASAGEDETVRLWNVVDKPVAEPFPRILAGHKGRVTAVAFHPNGKMLASGGVDQTVRLWDIATGATIALLYGHEHWVWALAFHPSGTTLASAGYDHAVRLWDMQTASEYATLRGHTDVVSGVVFARGGAYLATCSFDGTVRLWDAPTGQPLQTLMTLPDEVNAIAISPDGDFLAYGGDDNVARLWDLRSGAVRHVLHGHDSDILTVAFSPDGRTLATGGSDQTVRLWDAPTGRLRHMIIGHSQSIRTLAYHPNGKLVASAHYDYLVRLWNMESTTVDQVLQGHTKAVQTVTLSRDGAWLASGGDDQTILVWQLSALDVSNPARVVNGAPDEAEKSGEVTQTRAQRRHILYSQHGRVTALAFSPDGATLVSGGFGHSVCLWDVESGRVRQLLPGHDSPVAGIQFSPDGSLLAIVSRNQKIRLWDMHNDMLLHLWRGHEGVIYAVAFSPDGQTLATAGGDGVVCLWDVRAPGQPVLSATLRGHSDRVFAIAFSADGRHLVSSSADRSVAVWDMQSCQLIRMMQGHTRLVWAVGISPDGTRAASGGPDETLRLWDIKTGTCLAVLSGSGPYAGMNISRVTGISQMQRRTLRRLGAVEMS